MAVTDGDARVVTAPTSMSRAEDSRAGWCSPRALLGAALVAPASAIVAAVALSDRATGDYAAHGAAISDNAGPALSALARGDLAGFAAHQPAMGLSSLIVRAPLVSLVHELGGGDLLAYRLGAAACMLPLALLAAWLIAQPRSSALPRLAGAAAALLLLLSPAVRAAVADGHPEDVFAAVLATGAVLAAIRGRVGWAAAMLALAIGSKPWGVIAVAPVLIAAPPRQRVRTAVRTAAMAAAMTLALPLADPAAFVRAVRSIGHTHLVNAFSMWWPLSHPFKLPNGRLGTARWLPLGLLRSSASLATLALAGLAIAPVWAHRRREARGCDALALLALLGLLRCFCDTTQLEYYRVAVLIPLVVWEVEGLRRPPVVGALVSGAVALMATAGHVEPAVINVVSVGLTLTLLAYLAHEAFGGRGARSVKPPRALVDT